VWASSDGGATWAAGGSLAVGYFAQTAVRADGTLVVFYVDVGRHAYVTASSSDGGVTFSAPAAVAPAAARLGQKGLRAPSLPSLAQTGTGELVAVWTSCADSACAETGVTLTRSSDGGATWTAPRTLALGRGVHVAPSVAADPVTGRLALNDYVTTAPTCCALVAQVATSVDDGATWTVRRASVRPFQRSWLAPARGGSFLGDYVATTFANGKAISVMPFAEPPLAGRLREDLYAVRF
jgi:hypothetical protein